MAMLRLTLLEAACCLALAPTEAPPAQEPNVATRESSFVATVEKIATFTRLVTFRSGDTLTEIYVPTDIGGFDQLRPGDRVTVRYFDSIVVRVDPRAKSGPVEDTTAAARSEAMGDEPTVLKQLKMVVTIDSIDPVRQLVVYRGQDNRRVMRAVQTPALLEGIKAGDRVEITSTRARAISIERGPR